MNTKDWDDVETLARGFGGAYAAAMVRATRDDWEATRTLAEAYVSAASREVNGEAETLSPGAVREALARVRAAESERDDARADNAALLAFVRSVREMFLTGNWHKYVKEEAERLSREPHPGEALLSTLEETNCALEVATAAAKGEREAHAEFRARVRDVLRTTHDESASWLAGLREDRRPAHAEYEQGVRDTCADMAKDLGLSLEPTAPAGGES